MHKIDHNDNANYPKREVLWAVDANFSEASGGTREASSPTNVSLLRGGSANLLLACVQE